MRPFTRTELEDRVRRAQRSCTEAGVAGLILAPGPDLTYFAGELPIAASERLVAMMVPADDDPFLLVPALESAAIEASLTDRRTRVIPWKDGADPFSVAAEHLGDAAGRTYAVSDSAWALQLIGLQESLPRARFVSMTSAFPLLRAVKDAGEIERLAAAGAAADAAFEQIVTVRFAGRRELDIAADLADLLGRFGHERVDFTIVAAGTHGADPHHRPTERVIAAGDAVVMDFGGLKDGYGSDTTRTVHVGEPAQRFVAVHDLVRLAQQAAFESVRPGVPCQEIDRTARALIADAGYGDQFIHRVGHGIGLTTHEPPYMVEGEVHPIEEGMCFSIEPGVYLPGEFGVRIEDIVVATSDGARRLNDSARELRIVA